MAQTKGGSQSRSGSKKTTAAKKSTSGSKSSTAKKPANTSSRSSTAKKTSAQSSAASRKTAVMPEETVHPARRKGAASLLIFFALVALICYFEVDAWLVSAFRSLCMGLFGWGFYAVCPALLLAAAVLAGDQENPVAGRIACALLLPLAFGACIHLLLCKGTDYLSGGSGTVIRGLWEGGLMPATRCGGVLAGLLEELLECLIGAVGAAVVLFAGLAGLLYASSRGLFASLRERLGVYATEDYGDYTEDDDYLPIDDFVPRGRKNTASTAPKKTASEAELYKQLKILDYDIPLDDTPSRPKSAAKPEQTAREAKESKMGRSTRTPKATSSAKKPKDFKAELFDFEKEEERYAQSNKPAKSETPAVRDTADVEPVSIEEAAAIAGVELKSTQLDGESAQRAKPEKLNIDKAAEAEKVAAEIAKAEEEEKPEYQFPPLQLLTAGKSTQTDSRDEIAQNRERLESTIRSFGVSAHVVDVTHGPTVTRFDLELDQGVKLNKVTNLAGDIALSLGVVSVRIAPIPDKISTVGVEVPNHSVATVWLREIISSSNFEKANSKLSFAIGKDIGGNAIVGNISKLPHLLIAGTTGSGKSVCINSLILSLLYKSTPEEVRMIMIDPKMVELGIYNGMPHLYVPVVTDPKKAAGALQWSVVEMLKRYRLFSEVGVRDLAGYNAYQRKHGEPTMPQVVIIIDELADLMLVASKEVEESICRVAQMGRAAGMHLVIATQRPSADVITGLMKANIPSRIAFAVSSALESRIIMDQSGAEKLIGQGDMLYCPLGIGKPMRVQGAFVTDEEREKVIEFVKKDAEATYSDEILAEIEKAAAAKSDKGSKGGDADDGDSGSDSDFDELLPDAVDVVLELKQASVSSLQRKLKLGYSRAARIVDQMEELGVVGPYEGSKPRKVLITRQQWQEMQYATGVAPADSIAAEFADVAEDADFAPLPETAEETDGEEL